MHREDVMMFTFGQYSELLCILSDDIFTNTRLVSEPHSPIGGV